MYLATSRGKYPTYHMNDVYNAPDWWFVPGVCLTPPKVARQLGICTSSLLNHVDALGLSVLRKPGSNRRLFLVSEVEALKEKIAGATIEDVLREPGKKRKKWNGRNGGYKNGLLGAVKTRGNGV